MLRSALPLLVALVVAGGFASPSLADEAPYVGVWDCGVGVFTFTYKSYNAGDGPMGFESVEQDGNTSVISFADGYQIGVSVNPDGTMQWLSMESGDSFDCTRLYY